MENEESFIYVVRGTKERHDGSIYYVYLHVSEDDRVITTSEHSESTFFDSESDARIYAEDFKNKELRRKNPNITPLSFEILKYKTVLVDSEEI